MRTRLRSNIRGGGSSVGNHEQTSQARPTVLLLVILHSSTDRATTPVCGMGAAAAAGITEACDGAADAAAPACAYDDGALHYCGVACITCAFSFHLSGLAQRL